MTICLERKDQDEVRRARKEKEREKGNWILAGD